MKVLEKGNRYSKVPLMAHFNKDVPLQSKNSISVRLKAFLLVCCFTIMQMVPAAINGYPFVFFDSRGYHNAGKAVVQTIAGKTWSNETQPGEAVLETEIQNEPSFNEPIAVGQENKRAIPMSRSPYYGSLVFIFLSSEPFLLAFFQSLVVAYAAWLVVKQFCPNTMARAYLSVGAACALFTPLPYFSAYAMPDVFVALVPICIFLICFSRRTLSTMQVVFCWLALTASVAIHSSHLLLTFGLLLFLLIMSAWPALRPTFSGWLTSLSALVVGVFAVLAFAFVSQAVFGSWPQSLPFLTARGIEDGPVAELVANDCDGHEFAICEASPLSNLDSQFFLWHPDGFYQSADNETKQKLSNEDFEVFLTAAREHPTMQLLASLKNIAEQLSQFGLHEFGTAKRVFAETAPNFMDGTNLERYGRSLAVLGLFPFATLSIIVYVVGAFSLLTVIYVFRYRKLSNSALALGTVILLALLLNAVVCGVLSDPHHRYQARIIWLLPFLASLLVLYVTEQNQKESAKLKV